MGILLNQKTPVRNEIKQFEIQKSLKWGLEGPWMRSTKVYRKVSLTTREEDILKFDTSMSTKQGHR